MERGHCFISHCNLAMEFTQSTKYRLADATGTARTRLFWRIHLGKISWQLQKTKRTTYWTLDIVDKMKWTPTPCDWLLILIFCLCFFISLIYASISYLERDFKQKMVKIFFGRGLCPHPLTELTLYLLWGLQCPQTTSWFTNALALCQW